MATSNVRALQITVEQQPPSLTPLPEKGEYSDGMPERSVWVCSPGRSGTLSIASQLDLSGDCRMFFEARPEWPHLWPDPHDPLSVPDRRTRIAKLGQDVLYGESSSHMALSLRGIAEHPGARIIFLHRDPREVINSMLCSTLFRRRERAQWPWVDDRSVGAGCDGRDMETRRAINWVTRVYREGLRLEGQAPGRVFRMTTKQLSSPQAIYALCEWLDIAPPAEKLLHRAAIDSRHKGGRHQSWDHQYDPLLPWGLMSELGYDDGG